MLSLNRGTASPLSRPVDYPAPSSQAEEHGGVRYSRETNYMVEDPIRALLSRLPKSSMLPRPAGAVAITRSRVVEAGGDPDTVAAWIESHGGSVQRTRPIKSRGLRPGRYVAREVPAEAFYVVPRDELSE